MVCGIDGGLCFIEVADNGPGLTAAAREQMFVPFFTTKSGGSGVGLSLARRIALSHAARSRWDPPRRMAQCSGSVCLWTKLAGLIP